MKCLINRLFLIIFVFAIAIFIPKNVNAYVNHTQNEAVNWATDKGNTKWSQDVDGAYGCQCVDLILAYYDYLVGYHVSGNANQYASNSLPSGWTRVYSNPRPGDIVVWGPGAAMGWYPLNECYANSSYGHIGIVWAVNNDGTISTIETNSTTVYAGYYQRYTNNVACYIRPDFSWYASKNPVNIGDKVYATLLIKNTWIPVVDSNSKVVLAKEERYDPYKMWRFERHSNGSYVIWNCGSERYLDITNLGDYDGATAKTTAYTGTPALSWFIYDGGNGSYILRPNYSDKVFDVRNGNNKVGDVLELWSYHGGNAQLFAIYEFQKVGTSSLNYTISDISTTFNWSNASNVTHYSLKIKSGKPGNVSNYKQITNLTNTTYSLSLPAGYYEVYVDACNWFSYNASNVVKFYVTKTQISNTNTSTNSSTNTGNSTNINQSSTANNTNHNNTNTNLNNANNQNTIPTNINKCNIALSKTAYTYTGKAIKPKVTVKNGNTILVENTNYIISYKNNKKVGTASVVITGKGNYTGTVTKTFKINPKGTSLKKLTKGKKQFKVTWKKQKKQTSGYEIQYSTNKKFKSGNKKVKIKKNKTTSSTVKKLKAKKKYYVRIRTYKTVNGKTYYSGWSKVKNVTTKK